MLIKAEDRGQRARLGWFVDTSEPVVSGEFGRAPGLGIWDLYRTSNGYFQASSNA